MPIQLLPPRLANQIAAGEVVERPASVVKELIENSLDAGATRIDLDIEKGGHKRIRLRDNGNGISHDELELALSRHATSKIATLDDLEQILSLGFRGEALASISSVSRLTLTSKPPTQEQAWQASCEGREMAVTLSPAAHPDGTTIDVADLFYNTPARRKFLRTEKTEFQHIEDVVKRIALSYPTVSFTMRHNGKNVKRFNGVQQDDISSRIAQVMGKSFVDNAIYMRSDYDGLFVEAWLGNEKMLRSSTDCQFSFVNRRGMRDKLMLHAIRQAYESAWGAVEQPSFVLYLSIDPREVDVNVHPAKHEVRFQQSRLVHDFICKSVCEALSENGELKSQRDSVNHDYIRPLHLVPPQERAQTRGASTSGNSQSFVSPGPASPAPRQIQTAEYSKNYQHLMNSGSDINAQNTTLSGFLSLSSSHRLYLIDEQCYLLNATALAGDWLVAQITAATTHQPLMMPVAIKEEKVSHNTLVLLQKAHFDVGRVAGKYRLQQVPAGCRHLPWVSLFPLLLCGEANTLEDLIRQGCQNAHWDIQSLFLIWQWFDSLPQQTQTQFVQDAARQQSVQTLIEHWPYDS